MNHYWVYVAIPAEADCLMRRIEAHTSDEAADKAKQLLLAAFPDDDPEDVLNECKIVRIVQVT